MSAMPTTATELNDWIRENFLVFRALGKAFFELPIQLAVPGSGQATLYKRVVYQTVALIGPERETVDAVVQALSPVVSDAEPLFIRRWFEYVEYEPTVARPLSVCGGVVFTASSQQKLHYLRGRLAFWREAPNMRIEQAGLLLPRDGTPKSI